MTLQKDLNVIHKRLRSVSAKVLRHTANVLLEEAAKQSELSKSQILSGKSRKSSYYRRHIYATLRQLGYSFPDIAYAFGRKHSSIIATLKLPVDPKLVSSLQKAAKAS